MPACPVPRVSFQNSAGPLVNISRDRFFSSNLPSRNGDVFVIFFFRPENSLRVINERKSKHEQNPILKLGCEHFFVTMFQLTIVTGQKERKKKKKTDGIFRQPLYHGYGYVKEQHTARYTPLSIRYRIDLDVVIIVVRFHIKRVTWRASLGIFQMGLAR